MKFVCHHPIQRLVKPSSSCQVAGKCMDKSFVTADLVGRCFDNAIWLGIGMAGFLYYPRKVRRDIEASRLTEEQGRSRLQIVQMLCYFAIGMGILRIFGVLP